MSERKSGGAPKGFDYSNPGYIAFGLVLEKATGRNMPALIQQRLARPPGLRHACLPTNGGPQPAWRPPRRSR
jgi:D-alanyl-D-alanine carboxypeptidase